MKIQPGEYTTRDGGRAIVAAVAPSPDKLGIETDFAVGWLICDGDYVVCSWSETGLCDSDAGKHPGDLMLPIAQATAPPSETN